MPDNLALKQIRQHLEQIQRSTALLHDFISLVGFKAYFVDGRWEFVRLPLVARRRVASAKVARHLKQARKRVSYAESSKYSREHP